MPNTEHVDNVDHVDYVDHVDHLLAVLRCPACLERLERAGAGLVCQRCGTEYPETGGRFDLRPRTRLVRSMELEIFPPGARPLPPLPHPLAQGPHPVIPLDPDDWSLNYGNRLTPTLTSYTPTARPGDVLLDVGCGDGRLGRWLADARGFDYLGMDYDNAEAPVFADAQLLPVADASVPVVVSFAVLEHVRSPARMAAEITRCLRPGGVFIGTVAFLEPFHMVSHFHHTHVGLQVVLRDAGLDIVGVESNDAWFGHQAILEMAGRGRAAAWAVRARRKLVRNVPQLHRAVKADPERLASVTAGFRFVARKPLVD